VTGVANSAPSFRGLLSFVLTDSAAFALCRKEFADVCQRNSVGNFVGNWMLETIIMYLKLGSREELLNTADQSRHTLRFMRTASNPEAIASVRSLGARNVVHMTQPALGLNHPAIEYRGPIVT
jgi:hypothetical protein